MDEPIISVSGLRGIIGKSLDPLLAIRYTVAFASTLNQQGPIVLTRDGRTTGSMLAQAISSGLLAIGRQVVYGDVAATPTTGVLVREHRAAGGIQISASHNPPEYNGIKLFNQHGRVIPAAEGERVIEAYRQFQFPSVPHSQVGKLFVAEDTTSAHLNSVLATVNVDAIRHKKYKVVLDSHHGAGSVLGRRLLEALGCQWQILGDKPDGLFERSPEPTEENLQQTTSLAKRLGADVVFCQDPDADRLAVIDELGNYIGEEYTLAITLNQALKTRQGPVVINCSSSKMSEDICRRYGCELFFSAVGEANVTDLMLEKNAVYGGEGNGGPIDPQVGYVRDSFVGMAQILNAMAEENKTVSQLVGEIPRYSIFKSKIDLPKERVPGLLDALSNAFASAKISRMDGMRIDWEDRWMLVRPSNTEPIVRAIAEARDPQAARDLCQQAAELARSLQS
jgi:phosphomannomutase